MTSFLSEMETLKIPEKVVFWATEHVFLENPQRTDQCIFLNGVLEGCPSACCNQNSFGFIVCGII